MNQPDAIPSRRQRVSLLGLVEVVCVLALAATLAGFLARAWWLLELTTHFRPHFGVVLLAACVFWLWRRRRRWAMACAVGVALNLMVVCPQFFGRDAASHGGSPIRLVSLNVHTENLRSDLVLNFLRDADADVVLLMEVNQRWLRELEPLKSLYPNQITEAREDNFGIALLSRIPWTNAVILEIGDAEIPSVAADVRVGGVSLHLLGTHPLPPGSAENARLRNQQLKQIADYARQRAGPVVVLGDLNTTPWSPYFADLLKASGLLDASKGSGVSGSWPAFVPVGRIPIDHYLVSPKVSVVDRRFGPRIGSDHLAVILDLLIGGATHEPSNPTVR